MHKPGVPCPMDGYSFAVGYQTGLLNRELQPPDAVDRYSFTLGSSKVRLSGRNTKQGNRSHPLLWQGSQGAAGAPVGNSGLQIGPWRVPPLSAGVNDAGKQGHDPRSDVGAGAVAEFTDDDPVA